MSADTRAHLARKMNERRVRLRKSWAEIARRAGMDESNLRRIRNGKIEISELAEVGLEDALELQSGSIRAFLAGSVSELTPVMQHVVDPRTASPEKLAEELEELREYLIKEHGSQRGLDLFAEDYQRLLGIRARERRKRDARTSRGRMELPVAGPNE